MFKLHSRRDILMTLLTGLSAFPLTPTDRQGQLKPDTFVRYFERIESSGADSIGLLGSTGNYAYLTSDERKRTLHFASEFLGGRTSLIVAHGALRTNPNYA